MEYNWYVMMVMTGKEERAKAEIARLWKPESGIPFVPRKEVYFARGGEKKIESKVLFPGYVFVQTKMESREFLNENKKWVQRSDVVLRGLRYGTSYEMAVRKDEKERLERLWNQEHCVALSQGIIVGKKVVITDGPLAGMESMIKKIDRHKRLAVVEMEFMGGVREMWLGVEILQVVDG